MTQLSQETAERTRQTSKRKEPVRELSFDQLAENRWSNLGLSAGCVLGLVGLPFLQLASLAQVLAIGQTVADGGDVAGGPTFFAFVWVLCALIAPFVLYRALGSSVIRLNTVDRELRWTRHLLGIPLPGRRVPFDSVKHIVTADYSASWTNVNTVNPAGGLSTTHKKWKAVELHFVDDDVALDLWQGKELPRGYSAKAIAEKLGWSYDRTARAAVPRKRKSKRTGH